MIDRDNFRYTATMANRLASLQAENRRLRKLTKNGRWGRILHQAHRDGEAMLVWRFSGFSISRRYCGEQGISYVRWQWARALLMTARIHDGTDITAADILEARSALERTVKRIEADDDDKLECLRLRMPRRFRWGEWRRWRE